VSLYKKFLLAAVFCSLMILIESCSSSVLVDVWNDPAYHESPLKKILIVSLRKNSVQRRIWEDAFVAELSKHGVKATSSYTIFPDVLPDTSQIIETVQGNGYDGILVIRLLQKETETHYVEGYVSSESRLRFNPFRNTYSTYYRDIEHPGYVDSSIVDRRAIEVWVIRVKERLIWGATSYTPERNTVEDVQNDIADLVIPSLQQSAIIESGK
jgi:hypothetical protein